jgi:hypothetical protein
MKGTLHLPRKKVSQDELQAVVMSNTRNSAMATAFRKLYGGKPIEGSPEPLVFQESKWQPGSPEQAINRQKRKDK